MPVMRRDSGLGRWLTSLVVTLRRRPSDRARILLASLGALLLSFALVGCDSSTDKARATAPAPATSPENPALSEPTTAETATASAEADEVPDSCGSLAIHKSGPLPGRETAGCLIDAMVTSGSLRQELASAGADSVTEVIFGRPYRARVTTADSVSTLVGPDFWSKRDGRPVKGVPNGTVDEELLYKLGRSFAKVHSPQGMKRVMADHGPFDVEYDVVDGGAIVTRLTGRGHPTVLGMKVTNYVMVLDDQYRPARINSTAVSEEFGISTDSVITYSDWGKIGPIEPPT